MTAHRLTFRLDVPRCTECGVEVTGDMWASNAECRDHPLDRWDDERGMTWLEGMMFREIPR